VTVVLGCVTAGCVCAAGNGGNVVWTSAAVGMGGLTLSSLFSGKGGNVAGIGLGGKTLGVPGPWSDAALDSINWLSAGGSFPKLVCAHAAQPAKATVMTASPAMA
jgi:hypothetical protein